MKVVQHPLPPMAWEGPRVCEWCCACIHMRALELVGMFVHIDVYSAAWLNAVRLRVAQRD